MLDQQANRRTDRSWEHVETVTKGVGIDTIGLAGPISASCIEDLLSSTTAREVDRHTGEIRTFPQTGHEALFPDNNLELKVLGAPSGQASWFLEFSVPRLLNGTNISPAPLESVLPLLRQMAGPMNDRIGWVGDPGQWRVTRLDIARDFHGVTARAQLLDGLAPILVPHATFNTRQYRDTLGGTATLIKGTSRRYTSTLYDKSVELRGKGARSVSEPGHVRYELRLRRPVLVERGIACVQDIASTQVELLARSYFKKSGYDLEVRGMNRTLLELAVIRDELNPSEARQLTKMLGILQMQAAGMDPCVSATTLKKHLDLASRLGVSAADFVHPGHDSLRLDFERGTQVRQ